MRSIGGLDLLRPIGRGVTGVVYEGRQRATGYRAAVKLLHESLVVRPDVRARFVREQHTVAALEHPRITRCLGVGMENKRLFIAAEYVDGGDATSLLGGLAPISQVVRIGADLFEGLEFIHDAGYVHRDIKPGNVLLHRPDGALRAKIADFGLVGFLQREGVPSLTDEGAIGGTASYMAPEQFIDFKHAPPAADIYSAAATIYHLLTGKSPLPKQAETTRQYDMLICAAEDERVPIRARRPDLDPELARLFDGLLTRSDSVRTAMTASDVATVLSRMAGAP